MYSGTPAAFAASITSSSVRRLPGDSSTPSVSTTTAFLPGRRDAASVSTP